MTSWGNCPVSINNQPHACILDAKPMQPSWANTDRGPLAEGRLAPRRAHGMQGNERVPERPHE